MKLLVDIGNSRLKWAFLSGDTLTLAEPLPHDSTSIQSTLLKQWWLLTETPTHLAISCVGNAGLQTLVMACARELWPKIVIITPQAQASFLGLHNAYPQPEKLGVDRWLAMLAMRQLFPEAACVIDCGTAITVDFIDAQGQHLGGVISPGLSLMKLSLAQGTAQLPYTETQFQAGLANATVAAIGNGTLYAATGLIEKIVRLQALTFKVFLTGGDAPVIASALALECTIYDDLVLRGLARLLE